MSLSVGELVGTLRLDDKGFTRGVEDAKGRMRGLGDSGVQATDRMGASWKQLAVTAAGSLAALKLADFAKSSITAAASLEQAVGGTEAVFGEARGAIDEFASHSATSLGLSERAFRDLTTRAGGQLKNLGFSVDEAASKSIELTQIGADLAATYGGTTAEAVEALGAAFRGEADPAERFGLSLNITAQNAKAVEMGLAASTSEVSAQAKAQATLALIMEQSADAQGQFGREADTAAGQAARLSAQWEDMQADLGQRLLPVLTEVGKVMSGVLGNDAAMAAVGIGAVGAAALLALPKIRDIKDAASALDISFASVGKNLAKGGLIVGGLMLIEEVLSRAFDGADTQAANLGRLEASLLRFGRSGEIAGELAEIAGDDFGTLEEALRDVDVSGLDNARASVDRFASSIPAAGRLLGTGFADDIDKAKQTVDDFDKALANIAATDPGKAFEILQAAAEQVGLPVEDLMPLLDDYDSQLGNVEAAAELAGDDVDEFGVATGDAAAEVESLTDAIDELLGRFFSVAETTIAQNDAIAAVDEHLAGLREEYGAGAMSLDINTEAGRRNAEMLQGLFEATGDTITAMDESGATSEELRAQWAADRAELSAVIERFRAAGVDVSAYDALLAEIDRLVETKVVAADHATPTIRAVEGARAELDGRSATVTIFRNFIDSLPGNFGKPFGGGRALGGPVEPGKFYEVTEGGVPELFRQAGRTFLLPGAGGGTVETIGEAMSRAGGYATPGPMVGGGGGGSGGGTTAVTPVTIDMRGAVVADGRQFQRMVVDSLAAAGRKGVSIEVRGRTL